MAPRAKKDNGEEAAAELSLEEKAEQAKGEELAEKYTAEQEARADDDPLKLQKRDAEPGEAVPAGDLSAAAAEEPEEE